MLTKISVIVPIYNGEKYIPDLIRQAEENQRQVEDKIEVELVLSNDNPNTVLDAYDSNIVEVKTINAELNGGIQQARIRGLNESCGEYVVFLDQDDKIFANYIKNQYEKIGDADAVVCRCIHDGKQFYNLDSPFERMITKEYMLTQGCPIISTGQVMFRRSSIPKCWKENVMKINGADDYLLYLCLIKEGKRFSLNQAVDFEHVVNGINASLDMLRMTESEREMVDILLKNKIFENEEVELLDKLLATITAKRLNMYSKFRKIFFTINRVLELKENGILIGDRLKQRSIQRVAIYGAGFVGKRIKGELDRSGVEVAFYIDRNAHYLDEKIAVFTLEEAPEKIDAILVTLVQGYERVEAELKQKYGDRILLLNQLL